MNQNLNQLARDKFDEQLLLTRWITQNNKSINLDAGIYVNVRERQTNIRSDDYFLFTEHIQVDFFEAKHIKNCIQHATHIYHSKQKEAKLIYPNIDMGFALLMQKGLK